MRAARQAGPPGRQSSAVRSTRRQYSAQHAQQVAPQDGLHIGLAIATLEQPPSQIWQAVDGLQALDKRESLITRPAPERVEREPVRAKRDRLHPGDACNVVDVRVQVLQVRLPGI